MKLYYTKEKPRGIVRKVYKEVSLKGWDMLPEGKRSILLKNPSGVRFVEFIREEIDK